MATTRPLKGRPRRTEAVKRLKLRQSTFLLWDHRKEALVRWPTRVTAANKQVAVKIKKSCCKYNMFAAKIK